MQIAAGVLDVKRTQQHDLKLIPAEGIFLEPGDIAFTKANGFPVIIARAGTDVFVAHAEYADVVDSVIKKFEDSGISRTDITMYFSMYTPGWESEFMDKAIHAGLRYLWASCPIAEFLTLAGAQVGGKYLITIQLDD